MRTITPYIIAVIVVVVLLGAYIERSQIPDTTPEIRETAQEYGKEVDKSLPPDLFHFDGCTFFPDSVFGTSLEEACLDHDIAYWYGGTANERLDADRRFKSDIAELGWVGWTIQYPVYTGARLFGDSFMTEYFKAYSGFRYSE